MFLRDGRLIVVKDFQLPEVKTKALMGVLTALQVGKKALMVDAGDNETLRLSARNLEDHQVLSPEGVNLYDLLRHDSLLCTEKAVRALEARCTDTPSGGQMQPGAQS